MDRGTSYLSLTNATLNSPVMRNTSKKFPFAYNLVLPNKLIYLDLSMATVEAKDLEEILATCHHLKKLSLESVPKVNINDLICDHIIQNADCLETLNLGRCEGLEYNGVKTIVSHCTNLEELNFGWSGLNQYV